jgi:GDP-L-fucose synthase
MPAARQPDPPPSSPGPQRNAATNPGGGHTRPIPHDAKIFVAGHRGLVGSAICRRLSQRGFTNVVTVPRRELDLRDQAAVNRWFDWERPDFVYLAAGTVGGIRANSTRQGEFLYDNLMIHGTVVEAARRSGVTKLLYLGSACVYPRLAEQPMPESALMTGPLEPTNSGYSLAKIAGIRLCGAYREQYGCNFISAMPTNLYGPGDNFDLTSSHVIPALMRKFHEARQQGDAAVEIWGTGSATREFMHVDDLADACLFLMERYDEQEHINVGTGVETPIADLAVMLRDLIHPDADLLFDSSRPDGMPRRALDNTKLHNLGWRHRIDLPDGLATTYDWYCQQPELDVRTVAEQRVGS